MRDEVIVASTVSEIASPSAVGDLDPYVFEVHSAHFQNGALPHLAAEGFAGSETVSLWKLTAGTWVQVYDGDGTAVQLTATNPQEGIRSTGVYGVSKSNDTGITVTMQMP